MFSSKDARHSTADPNSEINAEVDKQRKRRVAYLRSVDRKELLAMPPSFDEEVLIEDAPVVFTTYVKRQRDGHLLVVARSDQGGLLGLVTYGATDGFQIIEDGVVTDGSDDDVRDSLGSDTGPGYFLIVSAKRTLLVDGAGFLRS